MFSQGQGGGVWRTCGENGMIRERNIYEPPLFVTTDVILVTQRVINSLVHTMYIPWRIMLYVIMQHYFLSLRSERIYV